MAAPVPTSRVTPVGIMLDDGYQSLITLATDTDISFWEKGVTPPGWDGGDAIDITTMHNTTYRTSSPRALLTLTEMEATVGYDPAIYTDARDAINVRTTITVTWLDGSTLAFFGFLKSFEPDEMTEGEVPEATVTVQPTNYDHVNNVEEAPVLTSVTGT